MAKGRIISPHILCRYVENSYALRYCSSTFQAHSSLRFPVLAALGRLHVGLLPCILNSHLVKLVLIFPVPRSSGCLPGHGEQADTRGSHVEYMRVHCRSDGLGTSVAQPEPSLNAARRDQVSSCYHWATPVVFQEPWLSFVGP